MKMASIPINQNLTVAAILPAQHQQQTAPSDLQICQLQSIGSTADFKRIIHFRYVLLDFYNRTSITWPVWLESNVCKLLNATTSGFNKLESGSFQKFLFSLVFFVRSGFMQFTLMPKISHSCAILERNSP
jgi:hypothetical protein